MPNDAEYKLLELRRAYRRANNLDPQYATVGDAAGVIYDSSVPGNVFVRVLTSNGLSDRRSVRGPANTMQLYPGLNVRLEFDARGQLYIAGMDNAAQFASGANPNLASQPPQPRVTQDAVETLAVLPTSPPSLSVMVKAWPVIVSGTYYEFPGTLVDFTGSLPVTGSMMYGSIFIKNDYLTGEIKFSTQRSQADLPLGIADVQETITASTSTSTPVRAIKLINGQTQITLSDIQNDSKDLRQLVNARL